MHKTMVPFLDLNTHHRELALELRRTFTEALRSGEFVGGRAVQSFEEEFARFCGTRFCIGVGSGTDALRFALTAAGVREGDAVITVPNTFIATTEAISQAGAYPLFVDVDPRMYTISTHALAQFLQKRCEFSADRGTVHRQTGRRVSAIVPVHLYGQLADMDAISSLADRYRCAVVEDACQAHGAEYYSRRHDRWVRAGALGTAAAFSFYPGKNLGALGEGGAVTTDSQEVADRIRMLRDHGQRHKYFHEIEGYNGRLDAVQARVLSIKLRHLAGRNERRRQQARRYASLFERMPAIKTPFEPPWSRSVYHLYVVEVNERDRMREYLLEAGIQTGLHYPTPLHLQPAYARLELPAGTHPVTEGAAQRILSLPMFPELTLDMQRHVAVKMSEFVAEHDEQVGVVEHVPAAQGEV